MFDSTFAVSSSPWRHWGSVRRVESWANGKPRKGRIHVQESERISNLIGQERASVSESDAMTKRNMPTTQERRYSTLGPSSGELPCCHDDYA